jgi:hypothetical protein
MRTRNFPATPPAGQDFQAVPFKILGAAWEGGQSGGRPGKSGKPLSKMEEKPLRGMDACVPRHRR